VCNELEGTNVCNLRLDHGSCVEGQKKTKSNLNEGNPSLERFLNYRPLDYEARLSTHHRDNSFFEVLSYIAAVPLQVWSGPEGSRKLRFPDFITTVQDGGKVVSLTHRPPLPPGNTPGTPFC